MISTTRIIGRLTVTVEYLADISAAIKPLLNPDGSSDVAAIAEYEEFVLNALSIFDAHEFEILEEAESNQSHSIYFSLVKKDEFTNKDYKYVLFIRLSDHAISESRKGVRQQYYAKQADILKEPKSKKKQTWKFKDIIVNGELFDSYEDALYEIDKRLANI